MTPEPLTLHPTPATPPLGFRRATEEARFPLPVRLAWIAPGETVLAGTAYAVGDAGWAVIDCLSEEHRISVMLHYPQARMPSWRRIERGEVAL